MSTGEGLRARKKARTREELVSAAYSLVGAAGTSGLTADAVAARAGVSRRTFFNYFPSVESVLLAGVEEVLDSVRRALEDCPADEAVLDSLDRMLAPPAEERMFERIALLAVVGLESSTARSAMQELTHEWLTWFAAHQRGRSPEVTALYAVNLAAAVLASAQAAVHLWAEETGAALDPASVARLQELFVTSLRYLRTGFELPDPSPEEA